MITRIDQIDDAQCRSFQASFEIVGRRWNSGILLAVARGAVRFTDITTAVVGLSDRMLSQRVRELENADLLKRQVIASTPVQVRYQLTPRGLDLMNALQPLVAWGHRWENSDNSVRQDAAG